MPRSLGTCVIAAGGNEDYTATCTAFPNVSDDKTYRNNVANLVCDLRVRQPSGAYTRTVVLLAGGGGTGRFSALSNTEANVCQALLAAGCRVIEADWREPQPLNNSGGVFSGTQGPLALAVRTATMLRGIYDSATLHTIGLPFIVVGQSGGSSQLSYVLAHYDGNAFIDMAIISCGPPHGRLDYGMLGAKHRWWAGLVATYRTMGSDTGGLGAANLFFAYSMGEVQAGGTLTGYVSQSMMGGPNNYAYNDSVYNGSAAMLYPLVDLRCLYSDFDGSGAASVGRFYTQAIAGKSKTETIITGNVQHVDTPGSTAGSAYIVASVAAATYNH